ncbi:hypothetical protein ABH931_002024 [Streptacidiphilus sp. MAP12-33]|uniref:M15 family metallopeptidase n=1 Tax=Streptacidiphilus sp. MAP12-33 TaxID=3156266 RepID=UPI003517F199
MTHHEYRPRPGRPAPRAWRLAVALVAALLVAGCAATGGGGPAATPAITSASASLAPSPPVTSAPAAVSAATLDPVVSMITPAQWQRIVAVGAWHTGCPVGRQQLRRVTMTHWGFDGKLHRGVLVVNADVVSSVKRIFTRLLSDRFPIRQMEPIEQYGGDDNASMRADNSSAFNCRRASQANAPATDSPHANGRAIDLNPLENPWTDPRCHCWQPSSRYAARTPGTGKIIKGNAVWQAFHAEGWIWQDIKGADYQHFDTGYPSRPLPRTATSS